LSLIMRTRDYPYYRFLLQIIHLFYAYILAGGIIDNRSPFRKQSQEESEKKRQNLHQ